MMNSIDTDDGPKDVLHGLRPKKTDNSPYGLNIGEEMVSTLCSLEAELEEGCTNSNCGEELMRLYALTPIFPLLYLNANICSSLIK